VPLSRNALDIRTRLAKTKAVLASQLVGSLVCGLLIGPNCNVDQVIANAVGGRSPVTLATPNIQAVRSAESGKTLDHFHEPSSQARRRERGIVVRMRLRPLRLHVPPVTNASRSLAAWAGPKARMS
jgi:hypothetical protein